METQWADIANFLELLRSSLKALIDYLIGVLIALDKPIE